jgi:hypothetical protein
LAKGSVLLKKEHKARTYLDVAEHYLSETPFNKAVETSGVLRKAVECVVDEKVFNGQSPTRLSSKNNRIHWENLKNMCTDEELIETLKRIHDRVSGGMLHNGTEANENPIEKEEYDQMLADLKACICIGNS